jgi:hypothetical protein
VPRTSSHKHIKKLYLPLSFLLLKLMFSNKYIKQGCWTNAFSFDAGDGTKGLVHTKHMFHILSWSNAFID